MGDPVMTLDGEIFERWASEKWFRECDGQVRNLVHDLLYFQLSDYMNWLGVEALGS